MNDSRLGVFKSHLSVFICGELKFAAIVKSTNHLLGSSWRYAPVLEFGQCGLEVLIVVHSPLHVADCL